jgi:hypothetical protein
VRYTAPDEQSEVAPAPGAGPAAGESAAAASAQS